MASLIGMLVNNEETSYETSFCPGGTSSSAILLDGRIPFLDTRVSTNQDGSTKISVYRKPTHTDQYLNFQSNHHLQHKRAVVNTLMLRAQTLVTENEDRTRETQHVKQALKMNNYPEWMLTIPHPKSTTEDTEEPQNEKKIYASTPYIKGISERLQRAFKSHDVTLIHKPVNSLRSQLYVSRTQLSISRNAILCTRSIVRSVTRSTLAKRPALWKSEWKNTNQEVHQLFTSIVA